MAKLINVHCHLLNYQFISPTCFKSRSATLEWMLKHRRTRPLVRVVAAVMHHKKLGRLHEAFDLMQMSIADIARRLRGEMNASGIELAAPMIMDMGRAAFTENPRIPFNFQLKMVSDVSLEHLGYLTPFVMVDPRRLRASELLIRALEELGFYGVKMYPALGYHPDPTSIYNDPQTNEELHKMYDYCESRRVPITAHCSPGGAYSDDILRDKKVRAELTRPCSWAGVLKRYPRLFVNLAHFGQDLMSIKDPTSWASEIHELIRAYPGVYTDLSYNKHALMDKTRRPYLASLTEILDNNRVLHRRVLFGTDWNMTRHTWTETEYVKPFLQLGEQRLQAIAFENCLDFLFPERRYPERLGCFLKENGRSVSELPKWLLANLNL